MIVAVDVIVIIVLITSLDFFEGWEGKRGGIYHAIRAIHAGVSHAFIGAIAGFSYGTRPAAALQIRN